MEENQNAQCAHHAGNTSLGEQILVVDLTGTKVPTFVLCILCAVPTQVPTTVESRTIFTADEVPTEAFLAGMRVKN